VSHCSIVQALRAFGVPEITITAIQCFSLIGFAYVEVNGKKGVLITVRTGSGQGDPISSILFLLATEPLNRALAQNYTSLYTPHFSTFSPLSTISGMYILVDRC
jgi:hypothetical protein